MSSDILTIGLLGHSANSDNLGVGALTVAQIAIVEAAARRLGLPVRFIIFGWRDPRPPYVSGANIEILAFRARELLKPSGMYRHLRRCDLVLDIGAGDSFADIYGAMRFMKILVPKLLTVAAGRPLILSPQTMGPFKRWWTRRLALHALARAREVFTRDTLSTRFLGEIGFRGTVKESTDVALRLPFAAPAAREPGRVRVGINVSGLLFNGGYTRGNMFGLAADYPALMRALIGDMQARGAEVHLVGHVISVNHVVEDDYRVSETLAAEFPGTVLAPCFSSPSEAKHYIATLDFFMGARMHACIAAFSSGVPVVPMAYSRKFAGLFGTLGYDVTVDCRTETAEAIREKVAAGFDQRAALRARIADCVAEGERRLARYDAALDRCLAETAAGRGMAPAVPMAAPEARA